MKSSEKKEYLLDTYILLNMRNFFLLAISLFFLSCGPKELAKINNGETCQATIEGFFYYEDYWYGDKPLLTTMGVGRQKEFLKGKILEITDEGVVFDQDRVSPVYKPEPRLFLNREIYSLIDENGEIIIGEFPNSKIQTEYLDLIIRRDATNAELQKLRLKPNKPFGYCITPDSYTVESIIWKRKSGDIDRTAVEPVGKFMVNNNEVNYLGTISIGRIPVKNVDTLSLPIKIIHRAAQAGVANQFGLVGALVYQSSITAKGVIGMLDLHLYHSEDFEPIGGMKKTHIKLQHNFQK